MSEYRRFFVPAVGDTTEIDGAEFHHMTGVLRLKVGDEIVLCSGDGSDCRAIIREIGKKSLFAETLARSANDAEPRVDVTLIQAVCKGERMDWIAQKANELGVNRIVPFVSRFTTVKPDADKSERLRRIVTESAKQCGRARVPEVTAPVKFDEAIQMFQDFETVLFAYEQSVSGDLKQALGSAKKVALVVGSEGGFCAEEADAAVRAGAKIVTLGKRILRAETAAIAMLAATMYLAGEW